MTIQQRVLAAKHEHRACRRTLFVVAVRVGVELLELNSEPWFDPLRADPRFDELRRKMGL